MSTPKHRYYREPKNKRPMKETVSRKPKVRSGGDSLWHRLATRATDSGDRSPEAKPTGVQTKLKVGQPGDRYETEADRVADKVMRTPEPPSKLEPEDDEEALPAEVLSPAPAGMQRKENPGDSADLAPQPQAGEGASGIRSDLESQVASMQGGGQPLLDATRQFFEHRFGRDFRDVRVHTDSRAAETADALDARAFTNGRDQVYGPGEFSPGTREGRQLLAHELTHTIQQTGGTEHGQHNAGEHPEVPSVESGPGNATISRLPAGQVLQRAPKMAGFTWKVDHSNVGIGAVVDELATALAGLTGENKTVTKAYAYTLKKGKHLSWKEKIKSKLGKQTTWEQKANIYLRAIDFLRDNRDLFAVPDYWSTIDRVVAYCDSSALTWPTSLSDAFYENLLGQTIYEAGPLTATFKHRTSKTKYAVPGRIAGTKEFFPSGRDSLLRPAKSPKMPLSGSFPKGTDLLAGYGAQPGAVTTTAAEKLIKKFSSKIPAKLRSYLKVLATDGTIHTVLERFLSTDSGKFLMQPVGLGGLHYTHRQPPSIEVDSDVLPGSGVKDRELSDLELRVSLAHELYHYALDRMDAAVTEVGGASDHHLISIIEDRYRIIETIRAGKPPIGNDIEAVTGYAGSALRPDLKKLIEADDRAGLKKFVSTQEFMDAVAYGHLISPLSSMKFAMIKSGGFMFDPAQITDLAYLAAVNGVLIRRALIIAAEVSEKTGIPLYNVWTNKTYQTRVSAFISKFMTLVKSNRTAGASALAGTIK